MSSKNFLECRELDARGEVITQRTNTPVAIRFRYIGDGTVTSVTVDNSTEDFEFISVNADATTSTDTFTVADYATVGELADAVNAAGRFEALVLDTLRSYSTDDTFVDGEITSSTSEEGYTIWDLCVDTSAAFYFAACIDPKYRLFTRPGKAHRVHLDGYTYAITMATAAANSEQVWIRQGTVETQKIGRLSVQTTSTTRNFASGEGRLTAPDDAQIIVIVKDAAQLDDADANYLEVSGVIE